MSETVKTIDHVHIFKMDTSPTSDIRISTDEDDEFLDFYQPLVVYDHEETNDPSIKKIISPYQEDAFSERVLYEVVNNRLNFVVPDHLWEEINEAFAYYWNEVVGLYGDIFEGAMFNTIRDYLIADLFYCPDELLQEIVTAIQDFIENIPGVVIKD